MPQKSTNFEGVTLISNFRVGVNDNSLVINYFIKYLKMLYYLSVAIHKYLKMNLVGSFVLLILVGIISADIGHI